MYLIIKNKGVAPIEALTTFGVSTTRFSGNKDAVGQFGSGVKYSVGLLLRNNLNPTICLGKRRVEFFSAPMKVDDGLQSHDYNQICVNIDGEIKKLDTVLEHGVYDWTAVDMALREFVSNALDRSFREGMEAKDVEVEVTNHIVDDEGYTSVFVPFTNDIQKFYNELPKRFLHFSSNKDWQTKTIMAKAGRNFSDDRRSPVIYKKGVFVREVNTKYPSLFDYNLNDLKLDESRNVDDYKVRAEVVKQLRDADSKTLATIFRTLCTDTKHWETDGYFGLYCSYENQQYPKRAENWRAAWNSVATEKHLICPLLPEVLMHIKQKGYIPFPIHNQDWLTAMELYGIPAYKKILNEVQSRGKKISPPTQDCNALLSKVWRLLLKYDMTNGKQKPKIQCFNKQVEAAGTEIGLYHDGIVYIREDISTGNSEMLYQTILEEVVHHVTGAGDSSRELQEFTFKLISRMANKRKATS